MWVFSLDLLYILFKSPTIFLNDSNIEHFYISMYIIDDKY